MKEYILSVVSDLEAWAENADGPFERKKYDIESYVMMGIGIVKKKSQPRPIYLYFGSLISLLSSNDKCLDEIETISFGISLGQVIKPTLLNKTQAVWVKVDGGKIIDFSSIPLTLNDKNHIHEWITPDDHVNYVNIEYMLSVILYHTSLFRNFQFIIMGVLAELIDDKKVLQEIHDRFIAINRKVKPNDSL